MTFQSLLPYNATQFEIKVEEALQYNVDATLLNGFKFKEADRLRLSLIYEYDLGFVNIENLQDRIAEGIKFHRLQGTPYALKQALGWYNIDVDSIKIEEEGPGVHFAEFQVGFKEIPDNVAVQTIVDVAAFAKPLRSRLSRMYTPDYDIRRFILDDSPWGNLLDDDSGIFYKDTDTKISFGRRLWADASFHDYAFQYYNVSHKFAFAKIEDTFKLDYGFLDDTSLGRVDERNWYHSEKFIKNEAVIGQYMIDKQVIKPKTFSRAMIVLDVDAELDGAQCCFGCNYEEIIEEPFILDAGVLDGNIFRRKNVIADVRLYKSVSADGRYEYEMTATGFTCKSVLSVQAELDATLKIEGSKKNECVSIAAYNGNSTWHDHRHFDVPWSEQNFYVKTY